MTGKQEPGRNHDHDHSGDGHHHDPSRREILMGLGATALATAGSSLHHLDLCSGPRPGSWLRTPGVLCFASRR
jgi:hypothetical protein